MNKLLLIKKYFSLAAIFFQCLLPQLSFANGVIVPTDSSQADFLSAVKAALYHSTVDYRFANSTQDSVLFPNYGEYSVYWAASGANKGSLVFPDLLNPAFSGASNNEYPSYNWRSSDNYSLQFKTSTDRIAVFKSGIRQGGSSVSWEAVYFKNVFDSYLFDYIYYFLDEAAIDEKEISGGTQLLIIPAFSMNGRDNKYYIDSVFAFCPNVKIRLDNFLARGGTIYAEGNAVYFIEKLGYLSPGAVDFDNSVSPDPATNLIGINYSDSQNPISYTSQAVGSSLYSADIPMINAGEAEIISNITPTGTPAVFVLKGAQANGGRIVCNAGLPTIGGISRLSEGSRQLQWTFNTILYAFANRLDVTRSIYNELADGIVAGDNAIAYDAVDTFEVRLKIRNLSDKAITGVKITETANGFFAFVDVVSSDFTYNINGKYLTFTDVSIPPKSEAVIIYRLKTPDKTDKIHEEVNKYLTGSSYIYASVSTVEYSDDDGKRVFWKWRNYTDIMFSANLAADTDLNWKNFLGLYYQPFKVFMIMENKERTSAEETKYVQYIPKDVPFYWTDNTLNIPILKTPGGKYVDILKGSNDENNPEFDMDGDGHPDAWLDTASIYPKGYTIEEEEVYWLNPWEHLRSGDAFLYEDIDHDGLRAQDLDGDGIVDVEEPGDKIRVWKLTWDMGKVPGYQVYDPYCSYEIWVDPPDLVNLSAGVGYSKGLLEKPIDGMFYPYSPDIDKPNLSDTCWSHWMERDKNGELIWKQLIWQQIHNYEGFTFIDTLLQKYSLSATDNCAGTVPQPHREFIAVLSLGGEEIDMTHPTPQSSLYSNVKYKTIFNEPKTTPIRTTYTYYAPLPNPLQFEYLSNNYVATDPKNGDTLKYLPAWGPAKLTFDIDASTEYTYYWIRNVGHDVDYNDPSEKIEGVDKLGDGVFGYMLYDIPKGMGGYKITLPKKDDGSYDIDKIVQVDGHPFEKWLDNKNTLNAVEIWEDPFQYRVYIPQLLIPPALDDDNFDGTDDWLDDRGDRFCSATGYLHDAFMLDDGEKWKDYPKAPFKDDIYGMVDSGWYCGADNTYGDDFFENLGKTHIKINAIYEGLGKEGPLDISKGGWLVVEEIFGGSPWVIFSHTLSGYAVGTDIRLSSRAEPSMARFGLDTAYLKHLIYDANEPHEFNADFDPYHVSYGYGESTVTTCAGGKDPCSLLLPDITTSTIIDPDYSHCSLTLVPLADTSNPDLKNYPKNVSGSFVEVRIEVMNGTDDNWINTKVIPNIPEALGNTNIAMSYVAYPRPLVPAKVDPNTGEIIQGGDDIGAFRAGWRFNQPEGEVLIKMGNTLPLLQPSRRAYFIFLISVDEALANGVYNVNFAMDGNRIHYDGKNIGKVNFGIPDALFSIADRNASGKVSEFRKIVIGGASLNYLQSTMSEYAKGLGNAKWSVKDIKETDFDSLASALPVIYNEAAKTEEINLKEFKDFPSVEIPWLYILEKTEVNSLDAGYNAGESIKITERQDLSFTSASSPSSIVTGQPVYIDIAGAKIAPAKRIVSINGAPLKDGEEIKWAPGEEKDIEVALEATNYGNDVADGTVLNISLGAYFMPMEDKLPTFCTFDGENLKLEAGALLPGQTKRVSLHFGATNSACAKIYDSMNVIPSIDVMYKGSALPETFLYTDETDLDCPSNDFRIVSLTADKDLLEKGKPVQLSVLYQNGALDSRDILLNICAIIDGKDTIIIRSDSIQAMSVSEQKKISFEYVIPDSANFVEFFAAVDPENTLNEFCENNNIGSLSIPFKGPDWILDVITYPNPFDYKMRFSYILPRVMRNVNISIYMPEGGLVAELPNCPNGLGRHEAEWFAPNNTKGAYYYIISGVNEKGDREEYYGKIVKTK